MGKIAFVTGAAGFLGRNLLEVLRDEDWHVHAMLRHDMPQWMRSLPNLVISTGALDDASAVLRAMPEQCDAVFHLAGNTSSWVGDEKAIYRDNVLATQNVANAALQKSVCRLVMTSTLGVFDSSHGVIREQSPLLSENTRNPYLRTKLQADALLEDVQDRGLSVVRMHPGHILGRYDRSGWISLFAQAKANKLGLPPRGRASFCLASDVARAHVRAAVLPDVSPRYVIATADASYLDLFNGISKLMGTKPAKSTVPTLMIKAVARLAQWQSSISGRKPTITPGLADILGRDLLANAELARTELGLGSTAFEAMLGETHAYWKSPESGLG